MPELKDAPSLFERIKRECMPFANIPPQEGEFLLTQYIAANSTKEWRMSRSTAERRLKELEEKKVVSRRKGVYNGSSVNVYRFTE